MRGRCPIGVSVNARFGTEAIRHRSGLMQGRVEQPLRTGLCRFGLTHDVRARRPTTRRPHRADYSGRRSQLQRRCGTPLPAADSGRPGCSAWLRNASNAAKTPRALAARRHTELKRDGSDKGAKSASQVPTGGRRSHARSKRIAAALERLAPPPPRLPDFATRRRLRLAPGRRGWRRCRASTASNVAAQGHRPHARHPGGKHRALRPRPARQQCAAVGRARHGQIVAGQGRACRRSNRSLGAEPGCSS